MTGVTKAENKRRSDRFLAIACVIWRRKTGKGLLDLLDSLDTDFARAASAVRAGLLFDAEYQLVLYAIVQAVGYSSLEDMRALCKRIRFAVTQDEACQLAEWHAWRFLLKDSTPFEDHIPFAIHCAALANAGRPLAFARAARRAGPRTIVSVAHEYKKWKRQIGGVRP